ncbi:MAG: Na+/H+ antiporter subunit E [Roseinatronobacter sp.]
MQKTDDRAGAPHPAELSSMTALALRPKPQPPMARWRQFGVMLVALAVLWGVLTEFRVDALVFGVPAVLVGAGLLLVMPGTPAWRLSPRGAIAFALWFAVQSVRGAVDVAWRAFSPDMRLRPGFRSYQPVLPEGAPRIVFLNTITLLPGTLSAEIEGAEVIVHMLDTRADLQAELAALEARVAALFAVEITVGEAT